MLRQAAIYGSRAPNGVVIITTKKVKRISKLLIMVLNGGKRKVSGFFNK